MSKLTDAFDKRMALQMAQKGKEFTPEQMTEYRKNVLEALRLVALKKLGYVMPADDDEFMEMIDVSIAINECMQTLEKMQNDLMK